MLITSRWYSARWSLSRRFGAPHHPTFPTSNAEVDPVSPANQTTPLKALYTSRAGLEHHLWHVQNTVPPTAVRLDPGTTRAILMFHPFDASAATSFLRRSGPLEPQSWQHCGPQPCDTFSTLQRPFYGPLNGATPPCTTSVTLRPTTNPPPSASLRNTAPSSNEKQNRTSSPPQFL
jgi:hypothetical protein